MSRVRLFVTGTDTDVGKTRVTGLLARAARRQGRTVVACKVVASGVPPGHPGDDATHLGEAAGHAPLVFGTWETPVSPHRAALHCRMRCAAPSGAPAIAPTRGNRTRWCAGVRAHAVAAAEHRRSARVRRRPRLLVCAQIAA